MSLLRDRRNTAKPSPAKPMSIIAQVEVSGTMTAGLPMPGLSTTEYSSAPGKPGSRKILGSVHASEEPPVVVDEAAPINIAVLFEPLASAKDAMGVMFTVIE